MVVHKNYHDTSSYHTTAPHAKKHPSFQFQLHITPKQVRDPSSVYHGIIIGKLRRNVWIAFKNSW